MGGNRELAEGSAVELKEVFRPFGAWNFDSPMLHAGTTGVVEAVDPRTRAVIVRFPGHLPVRVPRALLKPTDAGATPVQRRAIPRSPVPPPGP